MNFFRQILDIITAPVRLLLAAPRKMLDGSRRMAGLSLPARLAILTQIVLVVIVVGAVLAFSVHQRAAAGQLADVLVVWFLHHCRGPSLRHPDRALQGPATLAGRRSIALSGHRSGLESGYRRGSTGRAST